jgi:hypothetical protein
LLNWGQRHYLLAISPQLRARGLIQSAELGQPQSVAPISMPQTD